MKKSAKKRVETTKDAPKMATQKPTSADETTKNETSADETRAASTISAIDSAYADALTAHERYADDAAPLSLFLIAFKKFYARAKIERRARFTSALPYFDAFARNVEALETDDDAEGAWRPWVEGCEVVARFDRSLVASQTPPARSIDELIALGVPRAQIAKIYNFRRPDGSPDVDAVERRDAWRAPSIPSDDPAEDDAAEIARLAVETLQKINEQNAADAETIDAETVEKLREIVDAATLDDSESDADEPTQGEIDARIDREILDGVPVRQIAARYGLTVDDVRRRADALGVAPSVSASDVPPRIVRAIEKRREALASGLTTFAEVARELSTSERALSVDDVRRALAQ